jgi:2-iminobutanoate/2-iminopropanoate deaminase
MKTIHTTRAPTPAGHYAQAVVHGSTVYVAGQLPLDPADPARAPGTIAEQAEQVVRNLAAVLQAAGSGLERVLQLTVYVTDLEHWGVVNETFARHFGAHRPARAVVPVGPLRKGCAIEVQAIAALRGAEPWPGEAGDPGGAGDAPPPGEIL